MVPTIVQALAFVPSVEQVATHRADDLSSAVIDPAYETVWTSFIDQRRAIKKAAAAARARGDLAEAARLDGQQRALKETALAGSYGAAEELNEKVYEGQALALDVYALDHRRRYGRIRRGARPLLRGGARHLHPGGRAVALGDLRAAPARPRPRLRLYGHRQHDAAAAGGHVRKRSLRAPCRRSWTGSSR